MWIGTRDNFATACKQPGAPAQWCAGEQFAIGELALIRDDVSAAVAAFKLAVAIDSTWSTAHLGLAHALAYARELDGALAAARKAQELEPLAWQPAAASANSRPGRQKAFQSKGVLPVANFRPLHDRVVVKRVKEEEKTRGGIIIPETAQEKPQEGEVVAVGPGARDEDGEYIKMDVKVGDRILFGKWSGTEVKIDGEELLIMKESDIMGVIESKKAKKPAEAA